MSGLFAGTPLERPVTCEVCERPLDACECPRDGAGRVCRPCDQRAVVRCEKRAGRKLVTVVQGLDPVASDLAAIVRELKTQCGAGGTVDGEVILVQGDHRDAVADLLESRGYPVRRG
jgi:translation initiation factor 1